MSTNNIIIAKAGKSFKLTANLQNSTNYYYGDRSKIIWKKRVFSKITEGDFLSFEKNDISNDTIYVNQLPIAKIKRTYQSYEIMIIESISTKKTGMYREIGAHLEDESTGIYNHLIFILLNSIY